MKNRFLFIILMLAVAPRASTQSASSKDVAAIRSATIYVLKNDSEQADEKELKRLKNKPEKLAEYEEKITQAKKMNAAFLKAAGSSWRFSAVDSGNYYSSELTAGPAYAVYYKVTRVQVVDENTGQVKRTIDPPFISVFLGQYKNGKEKEVYAEIGIPITAGFADFAHALMVIQDYFRSVENKTFKKLTCIGCVPDLYRPLVRREPNTLASVTLLVDKKYLSSRLSESAIARLYPHPFKIVTTDVINSAIDNNEKGYAFLAPSIVPNELLSMPLWCTFHVIHIAESKMISTDKGELLPPGSEVPQLTEAALKKIVALGD